MNKRETFYLTDDERAICQKLGISRKMLKKALTAFIYKTKLAEEATLKEIDKIIQIAKTKWIVDEEE